MTTQSKQSKAVKDLNGKIFSMLTVKSYAGISKHGRSQWLCLCGCGNEKVVDSGLLRRGKTKSCGCLKASKPTIIHGKTRTKIYSSWCAMIQRCENKNNSQYKGYGGRGINICDKWKDFNNFLTDMGARPKGMTLGRKDNDGDYSPENCRWETAKQQARNRRTSLIVKHNGEEKTLAEWAEIYGVKYKPLWARINDGWNMERALSEPLKLNSKDRL